MANGRSALRGGSVCRQSFRVPGPKYSAVERIQRGFGHDKSGAAAARTWLALIDHGDSTQSWNEADAFFRYDIK
jgi:hypothetical protein